MNTGLPLFSVAAAPCRNLTLPLLVHQVCVCVCFADFPFHLRVSVLEF